MRSLKFLRFFIFVLGLTLNNSLKSVLTLVALEKGGCLSTMNTLEALKDCFSQIGSFFPSPENLYCDNTNELYDLNDRNCMNYFYYTLNKYVTAIQETLKTKQLLQDACRNESSFQESVIKGPYFFLKNRLLLSSDNHFHVQDLLEKIFEVKIWLNENRIAQEEVYFIQKIIEDSKEKINKRIILNCPLFFSLQFFLDKCLITGLSSLFDIIERIDVFHRMFLSDDDFDQFRLLSKLQDIKKMLLINYKFEVMLLNRARQNKFLSALKYACYGSAILMMLSVACSSE